MYFTNRTHVNPILEFPCCAKAGSAIKSPRLFAMAKKVNPMMMDGIFHSTPRVTSKLTTSFASIPIHIIPVTNPNHGKADQ